jgi:spermidine synthase
MHRFWLFFLVLALTAATSTAADEAERPHIQSFPSEYGTVYVIDEGDLRILRVGSPQSVDQTVVNLRDPNAIPLEYVRVAALAFAQVENPRRALMIGLGGGAFARVVRRHFPEVVLDAVDIDPVVVKVAQSHFGVKNDARTRLFVGDGDAHIRQNPGPWDLIFVDAYTGEDIPAHLATSEFFARVRQRLAPGGVAVMNLAVEEKALESKIRRRFFEAFGSCTAVKEKRWGNVLLFGHDQQKVNPKGSLVKKTRALVGQRKLPTESIPLAKSAGPCAVNPPR